MIIQPPPNITGSLHLGHAQRAAVEDLMIRHARMLGRPALFLPGLDHASIAAQFVLDRILAGGGREPRRASGASATSSGCAVRRRDPRGDPRPAAAARRVARLGPPAVHDGRGLGARPSGSRSSRCTSAGLAYRTEALINWCPGCRTSVSDLEVIPTPETGTLWTIRYHLIDEATGEPRPGRDDHGRHDPARDDPRRHRRRRPSGRRALPRPRRAAVRIPFVERDVPIIADAVVDPAFGTGAVKITPAHDQDDYADRACATACRCRRSSTTRAAINDTGTAYDGLDRYEARAAIVADLEARGDLAGETPHEMVIGRCQRSNDVIEPRLKTQWFIRTEPLAAPRSRRRGAGRTRIVPERFEKTWEHWLTNIRDWNVSRQLWWGHRIPAWYCPDGHVTVIGRVGGPACLRGLRPPGRASSSQDPDIFDTWFSSGLWPFSTLGWPDDTADLRRFYPSRSWRPATTSSSSGSPG